MARDLCSRAAHRDLPRRSLAAERVEEPRLPGARPHPRVAHQCRSIPMSGGVTEPEARALVARSGRVLERIGQGDLAWGHTSARDAEGRGVWTKPAGAGFDEVQDDDVILIGWEGEVLVGDGPRHVEFHIHTEIMRARPDVNGIVHTHPVHAIALAATGQPLAPLSHEGCQFVPPDIARFTATTDVINSRERGEQLVDALSDRNAALMIGHGIVTVGSSLGTAVGAAYHL